jgi:octaprenyl-diphosphate synthase
MIRSRFPLPANEPAGRGYVAGKGVDAHSGRRVALKNLSGLGRSRISARLPMRTRNEMFALVKGPLKAVDELYVKHLASPVSIVSEIGDFVAQSGGKRIRPALHLLCTRLCGYRGPHDLILATVLEYIHTATLIHDDIIDDAHIRRGRSSVNHRWGNNITVLFGDNLLAKAMDLALEAESLVIMKKLAEVTLRMTEGEMLQTRYAGRLDLTAAEYLYMVDRKTAVLFGCCCELAGLLAEVDERQRTALLGFGQNLGMAFQLVDDLLDLTGDTATLGKPAGSDLREGKATMAVIDLLSSGSLDARALAKRLMEDGPDDTVEMEKFTRLLMDSGSIERAYEKARNYAAQAVEELNNFDDGPARVALVSLADVVINRQR